jgi:hypothetical protein
LGDTVLGCANATPNANAPASHRVLFIVSSVVVHARGGVYVFRQAVSKAGSLLPTCYLGRYKHVRLWA